MQPSERIAEIQEFLRFVAEDWPALRNKVSDQLAKRCYRCILSERCVRLIDGVCELCLAAQSAGPHKQENGNRAELERQLSELLNSYSGKGRGSYDALVLFSGGKDSAYLLHRLREEFTELRLVAVTIDNGFFSPVAMANCRRILERIDGVDHLVFKPEKGLYVKTFRHAFTHLNEGGCYATVDRMDGDLTFDIGRNLAAWLDIPFVIAGLSPEQIERILGLSSFETRAEDERQARTHSAGFALADLYTQQELRKYWWNGSAWPQERVPRVLYPYYAWNYDEDLIRKMVVELKLLEPGQDNPLVTNNDTIPLMLAVDVCKLGYSSFEPEFARLIRLGRTDRESWLAVFESLEFLTCRGQFLPRSIADAVSRLELSHCELHVMGLPR